MELSGTLSIDTISEKTSANGVRIDSVLIKDNTVTGHTITATNFNVGSRNIVSASAQGSFSDLELKSNGTTGILAYGETGNMELIGTLKVDTINEKTTNGNISIAASGSGKIIIDGLSWPTADGSSGQVLKTDGSGNLAWVSNSATLSGAGSTIDTEDLTVSRALISNANGKIAISAVTDTELGYLDGVTSAIQTQIDGKQASLTFGIANTNAVKVDHASVTDTDYAKFTVNGLEGRSASEVKTDLSLNNVENTTISTWTGSSNITTVGTLTALQVDYININGSAITSTETNGNITVTPNGSGKIVLDGLSWPTADGSSDQVLKTDGSGNLAWVSNSATLSGAGSTIDTENLTVSRALISNASGKVAVSTVTDTELGYLDGVTSAIQTQIDSKQASLTFGIANTNTVKIDHASVADNDYAKFTANGLEGRSVGEVKTDLSLNNVENTAISTWAGSSNITTVGTLTALQVDYININGSAMTSTETNGNITVTPNGSGKIVLDGLSWPTADGSSDQVLKTDGSGNLAWVSNSATLSGAGSTIDTENLTVSRALISNASGKVAVSTVTDTELGYLDGVTSTIQTQIDSKQASLTFGIANTNTVKIDHASVADDDYAKFTANGLEGRSVGEVKTDLSLNNVENTAISTWTGSGNVTTVGTLTALQVDYININGSTITSTETNGNISVTPNGSGKIVLDGLSWPTADGSSNQVLKTDGLGNLAWVSNSATLSGAGSTIDTENLTVSRVLISNASGKVAVSDVTDTELGYLDGVTSAIQTQIDAKQATITGAATTIDTEDLTVSRALISNASGKVAASAVTDTELGYLDGVTSTIQTQIDSKQATLTFNAPSSNNANPSTSAQIKSALDGKQDTLTFGIANTNTVKIDHASVADNDYAKFTANGLEGRSAAELKTDLDVNSYKILSISSSSGYYRWNGSSNDYENIKLVRGLTYYIDLSVSGHPFRIQTSGNNTSGTLYTSGITHSDGSTGNSAHNKTSGRLTFTVPYDAPDTLYYQCQYHSGMHGKFLIVNSTNSAASYTPSSASDTGTAGDIAYDSNFVYICVATNTWERSALSTW